MKARLWRVLTVVTAGVLALAVHAQAPGGDLIGGKACMMCHRARDKELVTAYALTAHAKALTAVADAAIVADFAAAAPFTKDKVAFVLGVGHREQAFLDADLKVLPGLWKVADKKWVAQEAVDGATECVGCHTTGFDPATKQWKEPGVGCERCHGPGGNHKTATKETRKTTVLNPKTFEPHAQAMVCGQCHSRGRSKSSKCAYPESFTPGQNLEEVFTDAKPTETGRNQQFSELIQSPKHWAAGVVCEKCHDPHGNTKEPFQLRLPINDTCLQCHQEKVKSLAEHVKSHGQTAAADATCATCHMPEGRHLFDKTIAPK